MSRLRVQSVGVSLDGFAAGPNQDLENPLGIGGHAVFEWVFKTQGFKAMHGQEGGVTGVENDFFEIGFANLGAWIIGRNMFGPLRGPWPDETWQGWWGDEPPYHVPVFVLTHHARAPLRMKGGTTFHFVTGGIKEALNLARTAANGKDVRLGGRVSTIRSYLQARLIDEMHLAYCPVFLGQGENLLHDIDLSALGYQVTRHVMAESSLQVVITKQ
jgi:dihydrofolate reductase